MTLLSPMTEAEFSAYLEAAIPQFARDKVASGQWAEASAIELSRQGYAQLLPQGISTPGHHLYTIRDDGEGVGMVWFAAQERAAERIAYVYDVLVDARHQRKGHATRAFAALEEEVARLGLCGVALHVFAHNAGALALYQGLGFQPTNINMFKRIRQAGAGATGS
jgi:ribosomal protein S18 acetylase RimI-like enzyme